MESEEKKEEKGREGFYISLAKLYGTIIVAFAIGYFSYFFAVFYPPGYLKELVSRLAVPPQVVSQEQMKQEQPKKEEPKKAEEEQKPKPIEKKEAAPAPEAEAVQPAYTPEQGDMLSSRFGKDWEAVCEYNKKRNKIENCDQIYVGRAYDLPPGVQPRAKALKPRAMARKVLAAPGAGAANVFSYKNVGGAPLKGCGGKGADAINQEAWKLLGLSQAKQANLHKSILLGNFKLVRLEPGMRFKSVTFCEKGKVISRENVITAWPKGQEVLAEEYVFGDGTGLLRIQICGNWVPLERSGSGNPGIVPGPRVGEPETRRSEAVEAKSEESGADDGAFTLFHDA